MLHLISMAPATNSSSTHSVVMFPDADQNFSSDDVDNGTGYGWEDFVLGSKAAKTRYLLAQVQQQLREDWKEDMTDKMTPVMLALVEQAGLDADDLDLDFSSDYLDFYVDHQSAWALPFVDGRLDMDFVLALLDYLSRDDVAIVGGNDNEFGAYDDIKNEYRAGIMGYLTRYGDSTWSVQKADGYFLLFNTYTGYKFVLPRQQNADFDYEFPILIDMKITDFCPFGCAFCYQGSTTAGKHAPFNRIRYYIDLLAEAGVVELAIGGGEPTLHPDFINILWYARRAGIKPNFTTFLNPAKFSEALITAIELNHVDYSVSVSSLDDVMEIVNYNQDVRYRQRCKGVNVIPGTMPKDEFVRILELAAKEDLHVILLGLKAVGRGVDYEAEWSALELDDLRRGRISVDTQFCQLYPEIVAALDPSKMFHDPNEGAYSGYVDAVAQQIGRSSYHINTFKPLPYNADSSGFIDMWKLVRSSEDGR